MAWLDNIGLGQLWDRISAIFARKTEAGGSFGWNGTTLTLYAVAGNTLDSENLDNGLATDAQAAHNLSLSDSSLVLTSVSGATLATVSLADLINSAVSSGVGALNYGRYLSISGKTLTLYDQHNHYLDSVTLP